MIVTIMCMNQMLRLPIVYLSVGEPPRCSQTRISESHFNFRCQHRITYFISCPVKRRKATHRICFASLVRPCLSLRRARLPTDTFNYGQISDRSTVDSPYKSKWRGGGPVPWACSLYISEYVTGHRDTLSLFLRSVNSFLQLWTV